jgi:hypothetical protein
MFRCRGAPILARRCARKRYPAAAILTDRPKAAELPRPARSSRAFRRSFANALSAFNGYATHSCSAGQMLMLPRGSALPKYKPAPTWP